MRADIAVIGGGIAGVSAAAALAADADVVLLEAEAGLGYHAAGRSAAMFLGDYGNDSVRALNAASVADHAEADVLSPRGMLLLGRPDEAEAFAAEARAFGLAQIGVDAAEALLPILDTGAVGHAAHRDDVFDLDTDRLLQSFRAAASASGARIEAGIRVTGIARAGDGWRVDWPGGSATVASVVDAAGAWADPVAAMAGVRPLGLRPFRRSIARLAAPGGRDVSAWPFVDGVGESWYAKPDAGRWLVSPADEDPADPHDAFADDLVLARGLARYQSMVTETVTRPLHSWAGLRTFAPDRALVIGADAGAAGFWWCAGQGGYGFQTAPAAARLLADLVCGRQPDLDPAIVATLSPARFA